MEKQNIKNYIKIARPDHWIKNVFIFPGIVFAFILTGMPADYAWVGRLVLGFIATCFVASANYSINEWLDAEFDKYHPTKKHRPVVSENMKFSWVMVEYILLIILGLGCSAFLGKAFVWVEIVLLVMGVLYNVKPIRTKDIVIVDVLSESINNMLRLLLGWFVVTNEYIPPVSILIGYWMGGAFLMAVKRYAEYRMIGNPEVAGLYRKSFKHYSEALLLSSAVFYALCSTFLIGIFLIKYRVEYVIAVPVLFLLFSYYLYIAHKPDSAAQKPEKLFREKKLMLLVLIFMIVFLVLTFVDVPIPWEWENPLLYEL